MAALLEERSDVLAAGAVEPARVPGDKPPENLRVTCGGGVQLDSLALDERESDRPQPSLGLASVPLAPGELKAPHRKHPDEGRAAAAQEDSRPGEELDHDCRPGAALSGVRELPGRAREALAD